MADIKTVGSEHEVAIDAVMALLDETDLTDRTVPPVEPADPVPDSAKILSIKNKLLRPQDHNGFHGIARAENVSHKLVRLVYSRMQARLAEIAALEPVELQT